MTKKAILFGEIYPPNPAITIPMKQMELANNDALVGLIQFMVKDSKVIVAATWATEINLPDLTQTLRQTAETHIDFYCFLKGESRQFLYSLIHDLDAGHFEYIGVNWFDPGNMLGARDIDLDDLGLLTGEGLHKPFRRFLRNIREAKTGTAQDTAFHCNRAVESLMQYFRQTEGLNEADAWARLDSITAVERADFNRTIRQLNLGPRHGADVREEGDFISADERVAAVKMATQIGLEFSDWFKRGLTADDEGGV